jgi:hypothetical protein
MLVEKNSDKPKSTDQIGRQAISAHDRWIPDKSTLRLSPLITRR